MIKYTLLVLSVCSVAIALYTHAAPQESEAPGSAPEKAAGNTSTPPPSETDAPDAEVKAPPAETKPDPEGEPPTESEEGESLVPEEMEEGESLLPSGDGESLIPSGDGESLIPGIDALFPEPREDDPPPAETGEVKEIDSSPETTAAAAHTTYIKWLEEEKAFPTAVTCAKCHPDHFDEWSVSAHAYAQMSPVFNSMHATILKQTRGTNGDFCIRCHTQVGMQREEPLYTSNLKRHPASIEGITCVVCHRVNRNYGKVSGRTSIVEGDLLKEVYGPTGSKVLEAALKDKDRYKMQKDDIDGPRPVHADAVKFDPISTSGFCGSCHDVNLLNGFRLEEAFSQFKNAPANKRGENCQDCHMGVTPGIAKPKEERFASAREGGKNARMSLQELRESGERDANYAWAPAALVGDEREPTPPRKRTNHMFAGPDYSIIHPALFPHSKEIKDFTYENRVSDAINRAETAAEKKAEAAEAGTVVEFDRGKAEAEGVAMAKQYALADWLSFRWEEGWGTEAWEDAETERAKEDAKAEKEGRKVARKSWFAHLPASEQKPIIAAGWWDPDNWRKGLKRRTEARELLDRNLKLLNRIDVERHQIWRRGLQFGDFEVTKNDSRGLHFRVQAVNATDGHGVPTGFDAERLVYIEVTVTDRSGKVVFRSGDRDPNGDVRDLHSLYVHAGKLPIDKYLFNLQSKFLTRNLRGGEREQVLAVNHSPDPLPYIRPDTRPGILVARPAAARKHAKVLAPLGSRWAEYKVDRNQLTGAPYTVRLRWIAQMVPVNLIHEIGGVGFDYNMSPREVAKRVAYGHRVSPSKADSARRGGALTVWDRTIRIGANEKKTMSLKPTEAQIMAIPPAPFPTLPVEEEEEEEEPSADDPASDEGESLVPGDEGDGESLIPGGDEEGESLIPMEDLPAPSDEGESLIPGLETGDETQPDADEGENLLPDTD